MNTEEVVLPALSKNLIDKLDKLFPDKCADLTDDDRMVWYKSGQRSVINYLRRWYEVRVLLPPRMPPVVRKLVIEKLMAF